MNGLQEMETTFTQETLDFPCGIERLANGNTLITDAGDETGEGSKVIEVDQQGNTVWRFASGLLFAHSAKRLKDGTTLITDTTNNRLLLVSSEREVILNSDHWGRGTGRLSDGTHLHYPNYAHSLENGGFLITDRNNDRVIIVNREGAIRWSYQGDLQHPHNCHPAPGGSFLIGDSDNNRVIEIDKRGNTIWSYGDETPQSLSWPRNAERLSNGNTLITDSKHHRVIEVTQNKEIVWCFETSHFANLYQASRLKNDNTLISDQQHHQVIEVDPTGKIVWSFHNWRCRIPVYPRLINSSFREIDGDMPVGWVLARRLSEGGGRLIWHRDGSRAYPGLEYDRGGALCLQQTVAVAPGRRYRFWGRIRTEGVEGMACFQLAFLDEMRGLLEDVTQIPKGELLAGTNPWTTDAIEVVAPPKATAVEVRVFITGRGKVWGDDLHLVN